jgi:hypothetical protein
MREFAIDTVQSMPAMTLCPHLFRNSVCGIVMATIWGGSYNLSPQLQGFSGGATVVRMEVCRTYPAFGEGELRKDLTHFWFFEDAFFEKFPSDEF